MIYSREGLALTESFESCRKVAYQDLKGVWTIGYGHTGPDVHPGMTITQEQADAYLLEDVRHAADAVNRLLTVAITQSEFDALVDWTFNVGVGSLEHSTLLRDLNAGEFAGAESQFVLWDHVSGEVVQGLLRRRLAEEALFNK